MEFEMCLRNKFLLILLSSIWLSTCNAQDDFMERQFKLLRAAKTNESIKECTLRIVKDEKDALAYALRALAYSDQFRPKEAADDIRKAETLAPDDVNVASCRAIVLARFGKVQEAMEIVKRVEDQIENNSFALRAKAFVHQMEDDLWEAHKTIDLAIKARPSDPDLLVFKANCFMEQNLDAQAKELYDKALEIDPAAVTAKSYRAAVYALEGNFSQAAKDVSEVIKTVPDDSMAYFVRSMVYLQYAYEWTEGNQLNGEELTSEKAIELSLRDARMSIAINPRDPEFHTALLEYHMFNNDMEEALKVADQQIKLWRFDYQNWIGRAQIYAAMSKFDEMKSDFEQASKFNPNSHAPWMSQANSYYYAGRYPEAEKAFTKAIEMRPKKLTIAYRFRGKCRVYAGKYKQAQEDYAIALELEPKNFEVYVDLGDFWYRQSKWEKAEANLTKAIELNPQDSNAFRCRGNTRKNKEEWGKAVEDFNKAIELDSRNVLAIEGRGYVLANQKKYDEAGQDFEKAIELGPTDPFIPIYLARIKVLQKDFAAAEKIYTDMLGEKQEDFEVLHERARVRVRMKKLKEAESDFAQLIKLRPEDSFGLMARAEFYKSQGRIDDAVDDLVRAKEINNKLGLVDCSDLSIDELLGKYQCNPLGNTWHQGTISHAKYHLRDQPVLEWTNQAGAKWFLKLDLKRGLLLKEKGSPYYEDAKSGRAFKLKVETKSGKPVLIGFDFNGGSYSKVDKFDEIPESPLKPANETPKKKVPAKKAN